MAVLDLAGGVSREAQAEVENKEMPLGGVIGGMTKALSNVNSGVGLYEFVKRGWEHEYDPDFDLAAALPALTKDVPSEYHEKFKYTHSMDHGLAIKADIKRSMEDKEALARGGIGGAAAMLLAGAVDIDMVLNFGAVASKARKYNAAQRIMHGAAVGAASAGVTDGLLAEVGNTNTWSDVPTSMMMGMTFGGIAGAFGKQIRDKLDDIKPGLSVEVVDDEFTAAAKAKRTGEFDLPSNKTQDEWTAATESSRGTQAEFEDALNARRIVDEPIDGSTPDPVVNLANKFNQYQNDPHYSQAMNQLTEAMDDYTGARVFVPEEGRSLTDRSKELVDGLPTVNKPQGWLGAFSNVLDTKGLSDLYKRLWNSGSVTAKAAAVSLFESAEGFLVNNRSAAALQEHIFSHGYKNFTAAFDGVLEDMFHTAGIRPWQLKEKGVLAKQFSEDVIKAANDLRLGRDFSGYSPQVQKMLNTVQDFSEYMRQEARGGKTGARMVPGFENVKAREAYIPLNWSGEKIRAALSKFGRDKITAAVTKAYRAANPDMDASTAEAVAKALIRRGETKGTTIDTNLNSLLQGDGKSFLKQALLDNGMAADEVDSLMTKLAIRDQDKGKVGYARQRTDIDLSGTYEGLRIIDLIDSDLDKVMYRYSDTMSKRIALARHGIDSEAGIENIKNTIIYELTQGGKHSDEDLRAMRKVLDVGFQYFLPGSQDKNWNPWLRRAKQVTNLSLLSKLGLAQIAETAGIMAHAGINNFIAASPVFRNFIDVSKKMDRAKIMDDLGWMVGNLGYERGILRSDAVADLALDTMTQNNTFVKRLDDMIATGQQVQSVVSGYTKVMEAQINTGACAFTNKVFRKLKAEGYSATDPFWRSYGIGSAQAVELQKLIDSGTVKFNKYGHLDRLNPEQWSAKLRESYGLSTLRAVRQMVQRPLAGETVPWLHDSSVGIFGHLQTFPLLSMKKQFLRNAIRNDGTLETLTLYGIGTASVAGAIRNFTEGKDQTVDSIAKAALSYSNSVGWTTLGIDPLANLMGLGKYAPGGRYSGEFNLPMLNVAENVLKTPQSLVKALTPGTDFTKSDKRGLQVIPVVGSMYGMNRLLDTLVKEK